MLNTSLCQNLLFTNFYFSENSRSTTSDLVTWLKSQNGDRDFDAFFKSVIEDKQSYNLNNILDNSDVGFKENLQFYSLIQIALMSGYLTQLVGPLKLQIARNLRNQQLQRFCGKHKVLLPLILFVEQELQVKFKDQPSFMKEVFSDFFDLILQVRQSSFMRRYLIVYSSSFFLSYLETQMNHWFFGEYNSRKNPDMETLCVGFFSFLNTLTDLSKIVEKASINPILHSAILHYINFAYPIKFLNQWLPGFADRYVARKEFILFNRTRDYIPYDYLKKNYSVAENEINEIVFAVRNFQIDRYTDYTYKLYQDYFAGDLVLESI